MTATSSLTTGPADVVDCHVHAVPGPVMGAFRNWLDETGSLDEGPAAMWMDPAFEDVGRQVIDLDDHGIETGVVTWSSHAPTALHQAALAGRPPLRGPAMIATVNDDLRSMCRATGGRLLPTAWVDPRLTESALAEIDRLSQVDGVRAVSMLTCYPDRATGGLRFLDDPEFEVVLAAAAQAGVPVFVHAAAKLPLTAACSSPLPPAAQACVTGGLSMIVETALCAVRLVLAGVLDRHPSLTLVLGQLGGVLPVTFGRFDLLREMFALRQVAAGGKADDARHAAPVLQRIRDYTDRLYVDTHSMDGPALELALDVFGPDRVVFGSDYPVTPASLGRDGARQGIEDLGLEPQVTAQILAGNARRLLGLPTPGRPHRTTRTHQEVHA